MVAEATWGETIGDLAGDLDRIIGRRERLAADIGAAFLEHPLGKVLNSMCGFGPRTGARTLAEIGDPHRFANPARLAAYAGLAPVDRQSGRSHTTARSRGGNHRLHNAMFIAAFVASQHDPDARAYYLRKRAQGKEHTHNGMALSFGGHLRRWGGPLERGAGLTQKNTGVRLRCLCVDLSACPPVQGRAGFRLRADVT